MPCSRTKRLKSVGGVFVSPPAVVTWTVPSVIGTTATNGFETDERLRTGPAPRESAITMLPARTPTTWSLIYKTPEGTLKERLLNRDDEASVSLATVQPDSVHLLFNLWYRFDYSPSVQEIQMELWDDGVSHNSLRCSRAMREGSTT